MSQKQCRFFRIYSKPALYLPKASKIFTKIEDTTQVFWEPALYLPKNTEIFNTIADTMQVFFYLKKPAFYLPKTSQIFTKIADTVQVFWEPALYLPKMSEIFNKIEETMQVFWFDEKPALYLPKIVAWCLKLWLAIFLHVSFSVDFPTETNQRSLKTGWFYKKFLNEKKNIFLFI